MTNLTIEMLNSAVRSAAAIRLRRRLQPAGGQGDKVFPATYEGGQYALEDRVVDGKRVPCVLLDSVQSQANRMELALLAAHRAGQITIPVVGVDFASQGLPEVGTVTSLEAPHRLADAILRDSMLNGLKFRDSAEGKSLNTASVSNAAELFALCPTALVFGVWDSTGPRGGLGAKFQRALVGEMIAVDIASGVKPASRLDPLGIQLAAGPLYETKDGGWTLDEKAAAMEKGKAKKLGKEGKPSEANHGNVTPSLKNEKGQLHHGGVTMTHALQSMVLSLPALRRLSFPVSGKTGLDQDARTVLAALGLCGAVLAVEQGADLRSRCLLVPDTDHPAAWEIIAADGSVTPFALSGSAACDLLTQAVTTATKNGLPWTATPKGNGVTLQPSPGLAALVKKSRDLAMQTASEE